MENKKILGSLSSSITNRHFNKNGWTNFVLRILHLFGPHYVSPVIKLFLSISKDFFKSTKCKFKGIILL